MPEAILLQDVENVGEKGTVVDVSKGYLRNFLDPAQARPAGDEGPARAGRRQRQAAAERAAAAGDRGAPARAPRSSTAPSSRSPSRPATTAASSARSPRRTSPTRSRTPAASRSTSRKVHLEEPIRHVGTYQVVVEIGDGVTANVKTIVVDQR